MKFDIYLHLDHEPEKAVYWLTCSSIGDTHNRINDALRLDHIVRAYGVPTKNDKQQELAL